MKDYKHQEPKPCIWPFIVVAILALLFVMVVENPETTDVLPNNSYVQK